MFISGHEVEDHTGVQKLHPWVSNNYDDSWRSVDSEPWSSSCHHHNVLCLILVTYCDKDFSKYHNPKYIVDVQIF